MDKQWEIWQLQKWCIEKYIKYNKPMTKNIKIMCPSTDYSQVDQWIVICYTMQYIHTPAEENNIFFLLEKYIDQKTIGWQTKQKATHVWGQRMENMDVLVLNISEAELNALMMDKHGREK